MFQGSHNINMDAKGRLAIPAKVRETLMAMTGGKIVMTAHTQDRCVVVYPEDEWQSILPAIQNLPSMNPHVQRTQRLMLGYASPLELDSNGRVLIPPTLREYAGFEKKLMLVGMGNKVELWDEQKWHESVQKELDAPMPPELLALQF